MPYMGKIKFTDVPLEERNTKVCPVCGTKFFPKSGVHKFCSDKCKDKWKYLSGQQCTENQYKKISGNWYKYFQRLCCIKNREKLSPEFLISLLEKQNGYCALSGVPMTCLLIKGEKCWTNASIDRIIPGGEYSADNVRLVCAYPNLMRLNLTDSELKWWCERILETI